MSNFPHFTSSSSQQHVPINPPLRSSPSTFTPSSPPVKQQSCTRPQAIYLDCLPSQLPLIITTAHQLCEKYLDSTSESTVEGVLRGVAKLDGEVQRARGVRELVAAVLYCHYGRQIRLKLKEFARMNQLNPKLFNRKYVAYQTLCKRQGKMMEWGQRVKEEGVEVEVKIQQEKAKEEADDENETYERIPSPSQPSQTIRSPKQAIQLIYDGVFRSPCYQLSRRDIISKMTDRCSQIIPRVFPHMRWTNNTSLKLFYAIYARLKQLGMKVGFTRYRQTVATFAGCQLQISKALKTMRIVREIGGEAEEGEWNDEEHGEHQELDS